MVSSEHQFEFNYRVSVPEFPSKAEELTIWLPYPVDGRGQEILSIEIETELDYLIECDRQFGNSVLYAIAQNGPSEITMKVQAIRSEINIDTSKVIPFIPQNKPNFRYQLIENQFIKFTEEIQATAKALVTKYDDTIKIARGAYDYVLENMDYDKSGDGWGEGSTEYACAFGKGNCTDFHSLFIGIMRAAGIPSQFEIGVAFPGGVTEADITFFKCGYHCWATFYAPGLGWVPADCSEAAQKPALIEYYFGNIDSDRIMLSRGRDIALMPPAMSDPQNFFTDPVVETDSGVPVYYEKNLSFRTISKRG